MTTILLTGGTGTLGRQVAPLLQRPGDTVRILSRHQHASADGVSYVTGDLLRNVGIAQAVGGADTVVHLASGPRGDDRATDNLVRAASRAGVRHLVYISIIAVDRVPIGVYRRKLAAERIVAESGVPWTTLRAAQFHDLVLMLLQKLTKLPAVPVPSGVRLQPVDTREVAEQLAGLAFGTPAGRVPDLAGPTVYSVRELADSYLRARRKRRPMFAVRLPGKAGRAYRAGENLALEPADHGTRTWEDFLATRLRTDS